MTIDYEKELKESMQCILEGAVISAGAIATSELGNAVFKVSKPTLNLNMENIAKVVGYITVGVITYDMAIKYGWIKPPK